MSAYGIYRDILYPILSRIDAERVHERTLSLLELAQRWSPGRAFLRLLAGRVPQRPVAMAGLRFPNPVGVAAGFDKDARVIRGLGLLGFGHVEVGTLTPRPQEGNPRPRIFRLPEDLGLINRMGFPNRGAEAAGERLRAFREKVPQGTGPVVGVSLGKQKETPLAEAGEDYRAVLDAVYPHADYLAVNVSSPNTPGLRELQGGRWIQALLAGLVERSRERATELAISERPLLVKIAPDLSAGEIDEVLDAVQTAGAAGVIATNTSVSREGLRSPNRSEAGGLSGRPLAARSTEVIDHVHRVTDGALPILGVGGVFTPEDVLAKREAGASVVQVYTGLVYRGPRVVGRLVRG